MPLRQPRTDAPHESRTKLLNAAIQVVRTKGYSASTVDDICLQAGLTKGSFFHHFRSKDELAIAAVQHWSKETSAFFAGGPFHKSGDPLKRLLGYVEFRGAILHGNLMEYTCLLGTLVQETYDTHPAIRAACDAALSAHICELERDIEAARQKYAPEADWTAESVGYFVQSVLQGAFIFAKAKQGPEVVRDSLSHLRRYLIALFKESPEGGAERKAGSPAKRSTRVPSVSSGTN